MIAVGAAGDTLLAAALPAGALGAEPAVGTQPANSAAAMTNAKNRLCADFICNRKTSFKTKTQWQCAGTMVTSFALLRNAA